MNRSMKYGTAELCKKRISMLKAFTVTTFGFEIKIMGKCCVCAAQRARAASAPHAYCTRTA